MNKLYGKSPIATIARRVSLGACAAALLTGCGAIYYPVYAPSEQSLFIKDDERFPYDLQIVNLTIASAQEANVRWPYQPRGIPGVLRGDATLSPNVVDYVPSQLAAVHGPVIVTATTQSARTSFGLPQDDVRPYTIGPGDVLQVYNAADEVFSNPTAIEQSTYLVDQSGRIFVPRLDNINVSGKNVEQLRNEIRALMRQNLTGTPVAVVNVKEFNSQTYTVTGRSIRPITQKVTMQPVTLRQALLNVAAENVIYDTAEVILTRDGRQFSIDYPKIAYQGAGAQTILRDGDQVLIRDSSGASAVQADLQSRLGAQERTDLTREQIEAQQLQSELTAQQLQISRGAEAREQQTLDITRERLSLEQQRLQAEFDAQKRANEQLALARQQENRASQAFELQRLKDQREAEAFEIQRLKDQREAQAFELQRLKDQREAQAFELQRLKDQREAQAFELQRLKDEREAKAFNLQRNRESREQAALQLQIRQSELAQAGYELELAKSDRELAALELQRVRTQREQAALELSQSQFGLQQRGDTRSQQELDLSRLNTQQQIGALERDYVFVSGEVGETVRMEMPYGNSLSLADALFTAKGFNPVTGNPNGIHVVRTDKSDSVRPKVYVFKLDGANLANMSAATVFKMRPNDILYVTPQPIANWSRTLTQLLGGANGLIGAASRGVF